MGIFSRRAAPAAPAPVIDIEELTTAVANKVAGMLPAPTPVLPNVQTATASTSGAVTVEPLPRTEFGQGWAFNPGIPLVPMGIDPREPATGRPAPRRSEFPTSVNVQVTAGRLLPFKTLRDVAEGVDVIRRCIELRKAQQVALDWDIVLSRQAIKRIMTDDNITSQGKAAQVARERFAPEMARLREWWEDPDQFNQQNFDTWLALLMEEQLVIDAVSIYPRPLGNGTIGAFEILDGSTIKPLLDHRGATPVAPNPAYQQILYGFPRGEFTSSPSGVANGYRADQIVYRPRHRRTWTPYGSSNVEQALAAADIYLKRMNWIRNEFNEGATPDTFLKTPDTLKIDPQTIRSYEQAINAELAGADAERRHLRLLPPGWEPEAMSNFAELYKPELDELLIKLLCACFDVMPTEIGFPPGSGIGGKGHQEGEANSSQRKAVRPTAKWIEGLITDLSRTFLGMPRELEFKLLGYEVEDQESAENVADKQTRRGAITLNDDRAARGMPLYDFEEADEPFIVTGSGLVFLKGARAAQADAAGEGDSGGITPPAPEADVAVSAPPAPGSDSPPPQPANADADPGEPAYGDTPEDGDPINEEDPVPEGFIRVRGHIRRKGTPAAVAEAAKFVTFATKRVGRTWRDFGFVDVDETTAAALNDAGRAGDLDLVKTLVGELGKAKARTVSRAAKQKLIAAHASSLADAVRNLLPTSSKLLDGWEATKALTDNQAAARAYVDDVIDNDAGDVDDALEQLALAGHAAAYRAAWIIDDEPDDKPVTKTALTKVLDAIPESRELLLAMVVGLVADALISVDPASTLGDVLAGGPWAENFAGGELTASLTAGTLDSAERQQLAVVQIVAEPGNCSFCAMYDGRILHLDETSGMPPLHRGCSCDIEPLE